LKAFQNAAWFLAPPFFFEFPKASLTIKVSRQSSRWRSRGIGLLGRLRGRIAPSAMKKDHVKGISSQPVAGGDGAFDGDFLEKGIHEADIQEARYRPPSERLGWQDCARAVDLRRLDRGSDGTEQGHHGLEP
jgi:hypothetical protein